MKNTDKKAIQTLWAGHATVDVYSGFVNPIMPFLAANLGITLSVSTFFASGIFCHSFCGKPISTLIVSQS